MRKRRTQPSQGCYTSIAAQGEVYCEEDCYRRCGASHVWSGAPALLSPRSARALRKGPRLRLPIGVRKTPDMKTLRMLSLYATILTSAAILPCSAAPVALDLNQQATISSGTIRSPTEAVMQLRLQGGLHSPRVEHGRGTQRTDSTYVSAALCHLYATGRSGATRQRQKNARVAGEVHALGGHG
jgi:hypothetical protein